MEMGGGGDQSTLTILFTDVEGSTAFRTRAGDAAGNRVMAAHDRLVVEQVERHDGRHVKSLGDGCLAVFGSPRRAVECAVAVQRAAMTSPLQMRMGLNAGEVTLTGDDVFGAAVNAAARIAAKAAGGEILVSDLVRQLMGTAAGLELRDRGRVRLRGFPDRWRLYEVGWRDEQAAGGQADLAPFVGRAAELARLHRVLDNLPGGRGAAVVIRGEAGIGKTRLATEALGYAHSRGWRTLTGRASPLGGGLGLEPVVEAFGGLLRGLDRPALEALTGDLPHLARLFEGLGLGPPPAPLADPAMERTLLFESVARLLERAARDVPVVVLVDDIQWADTTTLELVAQLGRGLDRHPTALVLTYRPGEPNESDQLRSLLVSLRRLGVAEEIELARLNPATVEALAREFLGGRVPARLLDILLRAAGTPLFVDAFLRGLVDRGQLIRAGGAWTLTEGVVEIPAAARDVVLERLDRLDPSARRVVELVALSGGSLGYEVLSATGEVSGETLPGTVEHLTMAGVLVEEVGADDLAYRLAHPLYGEVAAGALPTIGQRRAHVALATALELLHPDDVEGLGRHYLAAGHAVDRATALPVLIEAGARVGRRGAHTEAVRFLDAAVDSARSQGRGDGFAPLLEQQAAARHRAGRTDTAVVSWTEALALWHSAGDVAAVARVHQALGTAEFDRGRLAEGCDHLDLAAGLLAGQAPTSQHAELHFARVTVLRRLGRHDEVGRAADELESVAVALGSARARCGAHYARAAALVDTGRPADALEHALAGLDWAGEADDDAVVYRLHTVVCDASAVLGDHTRLLEHSAEGHRLAGTMGVGILAGGAALWRVFGAVQSGAWEQGRAWNDADVEVAQRSGNDRLTASVGGIRAWLCALRGDLVEAEELISGLRERFGPALRDDRRGFGMVLRAEARLALEQDRPDRALAVMAGFDETSWDAFAWTAPAAEARARCGDLEATRRTSETLVAMGAPFMAAEGTYLLGLAHLSAGDPAEAEAPLVESAELFDRLAMPFFAARSRLDVGRALSLVDPGSAVAEAERALAAFEQLGAGLYAERARTLLGTLGVRTGGDRAAGRRSGPLSRREIEVARLVAEGLANAEIAERLTVSVRTVTSHLDHIYTRLGITSRAALARLVAAEPAEFGSAG